MSLFTSEVSQVSSVDRLVRPRSIALVGASTTVGSFGRSVLANLERAGFAGELHLVNPKRAAIGDRQCLPSIDLLPDGVDCAVLAIPREGVLDALAACARRNVGSAIVFSAGFAESDANGRAQQMELTRIAKESGMVVLGPNCLGIVNFVDGLPLTFISSAPARLGEREGIAIVSQSGAMAAVLGVSLAARGLGISYSISTGNEAATSVEDFVDYLVGNRHTRVITMIVEQFRQPRRFLDLVLLAEEQGKQIVLLHPGSSSAARASAATHTGAMAGDYQVMRTKVAHAGVVLVNTLEELEDVSELLLRWQRLPRGGASVLTESGAFKALTLDFCESIGLALPSLSDSTVGALLEALPAFIPPANPLDVTAHALVDPGLYRRTFPILLDEARIGSIVLAIILTDEGTSDLKLPPIIEAIRSVKPSKPLIFAGLDEGAQIPHRYVDELRALGIPFFPSPERAFRALAHLTNLPAHRLRARPIAAPEASARLSLSSGTMPEHCGKQVLAQAGIPIPKGGLAHSLDEALAIAGEIGFPVVLKAQSAKLSHKSDAGGVELNLDTPKALAAGWDRLHASVSRVMPELVLDGVLVEQMRRRGTELILGARNDPDWGTVVLVGFGGILAEAIHDVRLLPPDLTVDEVIAELYQLRCSAILRGFRGSPALDVKAAAEIVCRLGSLASSNPEIRELDINPVVLYPEGHGAVALDALIFLGTPQ
jgi:acyl-CoA synthetase (NDP forming)